MKEGKKILIGGRALNYYGSDRLTQDNDYFVWMDDDFSPFHTDAEPGADYINANSTNFFEELWNREKGNNTLIATPETLLELKCQAYIDHIRNGFYQKANSDRHDIGFLVIKFDLSLPPVFKKYATKAEYAEIEDIFRTIKR